MNSPSVVGRHEIGVRVVAFLASEWIVDLRMADDAVSHLRHVNGSVYTEALLQSPVARSAGTSVVEEPSSVARLSKVVPAVDRPRNQWRYLA